MALKTLVPWQIATERRPALHSLDDPFSRFHDEIDRVFGDFFTPRAASESKQTRSFWPALNLEEDQKAVHITLEVPGMEEKDIDITFEDDRIVIQGEKRFERSSDSDAPRRYYESNYGAFTRVVPLQSEIDDDNASAKLKDGVLRITLPKAEPSKSATKKISVLKH